jgi:hypothetical protein
LAAYGGFYLTVSYLINQSGQSFTFCMLKNLTGLPCPFCGGTRAVFALLRGELFQAFWLNPLATLGLLLVLPGYFVYAGLLRPRGWEKPLSKVSVILLIAALVVNWAYLIIAGR